MKRIFCLAVAGLFAFACFAQEPDIHTIKFYKTGDQTSMPVIQLGATEGLEVHFDDFSNRVRNYYYTFQLCNADWSRSPLQPFEYLKGFQNVRLSTYRNSSISTIRYIHYYGNVPDRNCYPSKSGNYLLKVYLDNDTSKVVFTRRMMVVNNASAISVQITQPFSATFYNTSQRLNIQLQTENNIRTLSPSDLKVVVLQNNSWATSLLLDRPTIYRGNYYEYNDETVTTLPAGKEFRWIDLRSLRLLSDRMQTMENIKDTTHVYVKPDLTRSGLPYIFFRDYGAAFTIEALESINPFWQGDYAYVHFRYTPPGGRAFEGRDVYLYGEMTNYTMDGSGKMVFNNETGNYETTLFLKQGYYNYAYITQPYGARTYPDFSQTEGNYYATENSYTIFVYYRPFGARADELIGYASAASGLFR